MIADRGKEATYSEGLNEITNQSSKQTNKQALLYLPSQIRFAIGGERVTCHGSKLANYFETFDRLARDQVVHLETEANLCANRPDLKRMLKGKPLKSGSASH